MKKPFFYIALIGMLLTVVISCDKFNGDQETPSYISISNISVSNNPLFIDSDEGFITNQIKSVLIIALNKEKNREEKIGVFELPCKVPILLKGYTNIQLQPIVLQDLNSSTETVYPFYNSINIPNVWLEEGIVTIIPDSVLHTQYNFASTGISWYENFENPSMSFLDTIIKKTSIHKKNGFYGGWIDLQSQESITLFSSQAFNVPNSQTGLGLYLEMDYWTEDILVIGLKSTLSDGTESVRWNQLYIPSVKDGSSPEEADHWRKIYVNLSNIWYHYFNYNPSFQIAFYAKKKEGSRYPGVYVDNLKLVHSK